MSDARTGRRRAAQLFAALMAAGAACGCVRQPLWVGDAGALVGEDLPATWTGDATIPAEAVTGWIEDFGSDRLAEWIREAARANRDLASARARVRQARERAVIDGAGRLPAVDADLRTFRSERLRGSGFSNVLANTFDFSLDLSWEIDLWGRIADLRAAELDRVAAESNLYESARLSLAANAAKAAFEIAESRAQIELAQRTLSSLRTNLEILDSKLEAGDAQDRIALEISLSRADIARAESNVLVERRELDGARRTLETLLGRYPSGEVEALSALPRPTREVPAGLPSELLLRRPDLLAAEARVDAALKELSASRKALLPSVDITGSLGTSTTDEFGDLFDIQNMVWNVGQSLSRPLYAGGRLRAEIRLDEHELEELAATYAETALTAFREVETALAAERYLAGQVEALSRAATESGRAEDLSLSDYEQGLIDIITLLESQRRSFDARSALLAARLERLRNRVDLYLALGGDFDHPPGEK